MVSTEITQAIIAGAGTIILALAGVIVAIWRHVENLHDNEAADKIADLQDYRWGSVSSEIQSLYIDVEEYLDENPYDDEDDIEYEAHLTNVIRDGVDIDDLEDLIENARNLDRPSQLYKEHESAYEACYWNLIRSAGMLFVFDTSIVIGLVLELKPFDGLYLLVNGVFGMIAILFAYEAIGDLAEARSKKQEFDDLWEEYRYEY